LKKEEDEKKALEQAIKENKQRLEEEEALKN